MEDRKFIVTDVEGNEKEMYVLFTTTLEETKKSYVYYRDYSDDNGQVYVSTYDENGNLGAVETEEEWSQLEEIFNQFIQEQANHSCCNSKDGCCCNGECDCEGEECSCDEECQCNCHSEEN